MKCPHHCGALLDLKLQWSLGPPPEGTLPFCSSAGAAVLVPLPCALFCFQGENKISQAWAEQLSCTCSLCSDSTCVFPLPSSLARVNLPEGEMQTYSEEEVFAPAISLPEETTDSG